MSIPFVHCCIILDWGLRCSSFIHSKQDSIIRERRKNLSAEKKLQFEFKFRIRLSKSSKILGRCKQTYEIVEILFGDCRVHYVNGAANVTSFFFFFFFLSFNVFNFFLSLHYLHLWCRLLPNYITEEFLMCLPTPS